MKQLEWTPNPDDPEFSVIAKALGLVYEATEDATGGFYWRFWRAVRGSHQAYPSLEAAKAAARADFASRIRPYLSPAPEVEGLLAEVRECCLIADDDGITVTEDPHLPADLFDRICAALAAHEEKP